jgi:putative SOS response-associated peptidase YedK
MRVCWPAKPNTTSADLLVDAFTLLTPLLGVPILLLMCGRYASPDEASIEREFNLVHKEWQFPPSYNVAPTQAVSVVRINKARERTGSLLRCGLIPFWAKGVQPDYSTINTTVLTEAATWRGPWSRG